MKGQGASPKSSLIPKDLILCLLSPVSICVKTPLVWAACVRTPTAFVGVPVQLAQASRFICNFIWEYFLKTCMTPPLFGVTWRAKLS